MRRKNLHSILLLWKWCFNYSERCKYLSYLSQSSLLTSRCFSFRLRWALIRKIWRVGELGWLASDGQVLCCSKRIRSLILLVIGLIEADLFFAFAAAVATIAAFSTAWRSCSFVFSSATNASLRCWSAFDELRSSKKGHEGMKIFCDLKNARNFENPFKPRNVT